MDYDEWTPLGRGDPLKNDPTFDYVPPVLDRVQYWLDSHTTEPSVKRDILVLGVTAKKTSPKIPEQFLKFVDGPKFNRNPEQQYRNEHILNRNDYTGSSGAEPPKIMRNTNFRNGMVDYRNHNRIQNIPASYYPSPFYNQKPKPYTMMLPPPVVPKPVDAAQPTYTPQKDKMAYAEQNQQFSTQTEEGPVQTERHPYNKPPMASYPQPRPPLRTMQSSLKPPSSKNQISQGETINSVFTPPAQTTRQKFQSVTTPSVSFEKSNLVYQSTQTVSGAWLANGGIPSESNQVTWQTPAKGQDHYDVTDSQAAASSSHEVVIGQNAKIIVDGENADNEEVVVGKKELSPQENFIAPTAAPSTDVVQSSMFSTAENDSGEIVVGQPSSLSSEMQMHIVVANTGPANTGLGNQKPKEPIAVIMPTNYMDKLNVTVGDSKNESENFTRDNNPNTMTSVIEQTIQISNSIPPPNSITDSPIPMPQMNYANQMNQINPMKPMNPVKPMNLMNQMNRMNQINQMNHMPQMNPMNTMNQVPHHMHQMNQIPTGSAFPVPNAQPLIQQNPNPEHMLMSHMPNTGMRHPPGGILSMPQQMFNGQPGHVMQQQQQQQQRPSTVERNPPVYSIPHPVQTPTTLRTEIPRDHPYYMQQVSNGVAPNIPFLPTPAAPVSKPETATSSLDLVTDYIKNQSPLAHLLNNEMNKARPPAMFTTTTTVSSLTTDPIFSHYKQPAKPIRGPMYLIIQGHSKVKTYKPSVNRHGVPVENNEIQEASTERPSKLEQLINENTRSRNLDKNVEKNLAAVEDERPRKNRLEQENLLSLVESNFSGFTVRPATGVEEERQSNSVTSTEVNN